MEAGGLQMWRLDMAANAATITANTLQKIQCHVRESFAQAFQQKTLARPLDCLDHASLFRCSSCDSLSSTLHLTENFPSDPMTLNLQSIHKSLNEIFHHIAMTERDFFQKRSFKYYNEHHYFLLRSP